MLPLLELAMRPEISTVVLAVGTQANGESQVRSTTSTTSKRTWLTEVGRILAGEVAPNGTATSTAATSIETSTAPAGGDGAGVGLE